jgi:hypothetical protein
MRHVLIGTSLLVVALMVTFGAATILQGIAEMTTANAEPFVIDKVRPTASATRGPRTEPAARSVNLASRQRDGI